MGLNGEASIFFCSREILELESRLENGAGVISGANNPVEQPQVHALEVSMSFGPDKSSVNVPIINEYCSCFIFHMTPFLTIVHKYSPLENVMIITCFKVAVFLYKKDLA